MKVDVDALAARFQQRFGDQPPDAPPRRFPKARAERYACSKCGETGHNTRTCLVVDELLTGWVTALKRQYHREWREANPDKVREYSRRAYADPSRRARKLERRREYLKRERERIRERRRARAESTRAARTAARIAKRDAMRMRRYGTANPREIKRIQGQRRNSPEFRARDRAREQVRSSIPAVRERLRVYRRQYDQRPEVRQRKRERARVRSREIRREQYLRRRNRITKSQWAAIAIAASKTTSTRRSK